ncbi:hypothetical protein BpHYR1_035271 [Brachionus plicatilis]|uniref:Uncharacterized protein n=1 Tax=Brachionus plicatilis TaxID=10195 RepID=A0A3M7Q9P0_BRAPC|nr:hypothetical protein BpHYR1_035271 [Brachionus plicatilis]
MKIKIFIYLLIQLTPILAISIPQNFFPRMSLEIFISSALIKINVMTYTVCVNFELTDWFFAVFFKCISSKLTHTICKKKKDVLQVIKLEIHALDMITKAQQKAMTIVGDRDIPAWQQLPIKEKAASKWSTKHSPVQSLTDMRL